MANPTHPAAAETPEAIAERIVAEAFATRRPGYVSTNLTFALANAIRAARNESYEEAAQVADTYLRLDGTTTSAEIASKIRALGATKRK